MVVLGAGTAGANAAYQLARRGLDVVLLDRRPAGLAGAQWSNGVLDWQFERAGLEPPVTPERESEAVTTHIVGPDGTHGVTVHDSPVVRADMRRLGDRLRHLAGSAGVELIDRIGTVEVEHTGGRLTALVVAPGETTSTGRATVDGHDDDGDHEPGDRAGRPPDGTLRFEAPLFVDASGRRGVLRRRSPVLTSWCPEVRGDELCTATDHHLRIADRDGARRFLERHGAEPGETVTMVGLAGGFSTRAIGIDADLDHASVLVGCLANGRYGSGPRLLEDTRRAEPWLGASISGGSGVIPLRRPYARFTAPGLALVGDAAAQVFPAHGSGIGVGLIAGTLLAEAVTAPDGSADLGDERRLWAYQAAFQHELGGLLNAFDAFRRMSTALGGKGVARMVRAGLLTEDMARGGLDQRWQTPPPDRVPGMAARLATVPDVAAKMLPLLARGQLLRRTGEAYPDAPDEAALARWDARVTRLLGPLPR